MLRFLLSLLLLVMVLPLMGCTQKSDSSNNSSEKTTIPEFWTGEKKDAVSSRDIGHCSKSEVAKRMNLPGFLMVNFSDEPLIFHSTEKVVKLNSKMMIDSGYRLESLSLWKSSETTKELYIGKFEGDKPLKTLVVYEQGGCM